MAAHRPPDWAETYFLSNPRVALECNMCTTAQDVHILWDTDGTDCELLVLKPPLFFKAQEMNAVYVRLNNTCEEHNFLKLSIKDTGWLILSVTHDMMPCSEVHRQVLVPS